LIATTFTQRYDSNLIPYWPWFQAGSSSVHGVPRIVRDMTVKKFTVLLSFLLLVVGVSPSATPAAEMHFVAAFDEHDDALQAIKRGEIMSYSQIKRSVESRLGARVVSLRLRRTNSGWRYFLRLTRKDGRVLAATVDAKNGRILSTQ